MWDQAQPYSEPGSQMLCAPGACLTQPGGPRVCLYPDGTASFPQTDASALALLGGAAPAPLCGGAPAIEPVSDDLCWLCHDVAMRDMPRGLALMCAKVCDRVK